MLDVVRRNPQFRRLWLAQVVSEAGDWLNRIAILGLIGALGGPAVEGDGAVVGLGLLFGIEIVTRMLPSALAGPIAGPIADRVSRRALMIAADLVRAGIVLCYLFIDGEGDLPLLYGLLISQMATSMFFNAARSAAVPNTVPPADLHAAYVLSAATWSTMLSVGAFLGAIVVRAVGVNGVFVLDALTFVASACLMLRLDAGRAPVHPERFRVRDILLFTDMRLGLAHVRKLGLLWPVLTKAFWGGAGGYLVLLSLTANERFSSGASPEVAAGAAGTAVGLLYCARGVGTGVGPILARRVFGEDDAALRRQITGGFVVGATGYLLLAAAPTLWIALLVVVFAHAGGSALWVGSTLLWQRRIEDRFRGRVFAIEFFMMTLAASISGLATGLYYDVTGSLEGSLVAVSCVVLVMGALWSVLERSASRRRSEVPLPSPPEPR